jgi:hypothetical protein
MKNYRALFTPSFREITEEEGKNILDTAHEVGPFVNLFPKEEEVSSLQTSRA